MIFFLSLLRLVKGYGGGEVARQGVGGGGGGGCARSSLIQVMTTDWLVGNLESGGASEELTLQRKLYLQRQTERGRVDVPLRKLY